MKKVLPGEFNYLSYKKKMETLKTILFFAVSFALFFAGWYTTKTRANLLTIVAVLGMLPACKSAVETFMYLKAKGCSETLKNTLSGHVEALQHSYSMVFTTPSDGTFEVPSIVVKNNTICGLVEHPYKKLPQLEKHITDICKQNGFKVVVKIFEKEDAYLARLTQLLEAETNSEKLDQEEMTLLHQISL